MFIKGIDNVSLMFKKTAVDSSYYLKDSSYKFDGHKYYLVNDSAFAFRRNIKDTVIYEPKEIRFITIPKHHLEIAILNRNQDTCMIEVWPPPFKDQNNPTYQKGHTVIAGIENDSLYNNSYNSADTLYAIFNWHHPSTTRRHETYNVLFRTIYLVPASIPLVYTTGSAQWQANFLNAGMAFGWGYGRTKFYKDNLMPPRNFYFGFGAVLGVSSITIDSQNVTKSLQPIIGKSSLTYPAVYGGVHIAFSFNSVQLMGVVGSEIVLSKYHSSWQNEGKLLYGIGIGLSIFNLAVPSAPSSPIGH
jgi:hypothetical protein